MFTREEFERRRAAVRRIDRREGRLLALVSVGLGVAQLLFLRWADARLPHRSAIGIEGALCIAYLALVGGMLLRMQRRLGAIRPRCPQCGVALKDMSERVAAATGRCDACGGQIIG